MSEVRRVVRADQGPNPRFALDESACEGGGIRSPFEACSRHSEHANSDDLDEVDARRDCGGVHLRRGAYLWQGRSASVGNGHGEQRRRHAVHGAGTGERQRAAFVCCQRVRRIEPVRVAISQWPGHMALLVGAGGLKTQPGSIAAAEGLDLEIQFIEDAPSKNEALSKGEVDFVWQTVDELPISLGAYRSAGVDVRAFMQIDWSRGGDACVASKDVLTVESVYGRKSAMLMFSPDHTVFEFMINNSRLTQEQVAEVRRSTKFSPDDPTFARTLFKEGKVDVACLWEPDVTLALEERPGAHRLFSTADATELVADVLLARQEFLESEPALAEKLARVWFKAVERANLDRAAAATLISTVASRFRDELGYDKTLKALNWARWTSFRTTYASSGSTEQSPPSIASTTRRIRSGSTTPRQRSRIALRRPC